MNRSWPALFHLLFWGGNLWFSLWSVLGLAPLVLLDMIDGAGQDLIPWSFVAFAAALVLLPPLGLVVGLHPRFRHDPVRLMGLLYGVEIPLMLLLGVRTFAVQQLSAGTTLALLLVATGAMSLLRTLWTGGAERSPVAQALQLIGQTGYMVVGTWFVLVVGLYGIPLALELTGMPTLSPGEQQLPVVWVLLCGAIAIFFICGFAVGAVTVRSFVMVWRPTTERWGRLPAIGIVAGTVAGWVGAFALTSVQPHLQAFELVEGVRSDEDRRAALERSEAIREGLVFGRLIPERTIEDDPRGRAVHGLWERSAGPDLADGALTVWTVLFAPFVHQPSEDRGADGDRDWDVPSDVNKASAAYAEFFDAPIEIAERDILLDAARQTWDRDAAAAGLLDIGQHKVHLARQETEVVAHGDLARVTVHEVYRNRTWDRQEVFVYFTLPESAAITGLWLSDDETRRFEYVVAPRGAAQEVYESQVRVSRDPALVEQVGPRQYRLRAFPIEPRTGSPADRSSRSAEGPEFHLWLELVVPSVSSAEGEASFPLPVATQVRNLFWDDDTVRELDGEPIELDAWLPARVAAPEAPRSHRVRVGDYLVEATPVTAIPAAPLRRLAVLVDSTRSMDAHRDAVQASLSELRGAAEELELDVYCTRETVLVRCDDYDPHTALMWGSTALETRLAELAPQVDDVDALVVLTDAGSYTLAADAEQAGLPDVELPPLWLVHLGGDPEAYPDWTLDRLSRSGGGVASSVEDVLVRLADASIVDGRRWSIVPAEPEVEMAPADDPFGALAARRLVAFLDAERRVSGLDALDRMHEVAVQRHVVTPYSSMLVLVEDAQRRALEEASMGEGRFDREVIEAGETVSSVPEPATLVLLGVGGLVAYRRRRERRAGTVAASSTSEAP